MVACPPTPHLRCARAGRSIPTHGERNKGMRRSVGLFFGVTTLVLSSFSLAQTTGGTKGTTTAGSASAKASASASAAPKTSTAAATSAAPVTSTASPTTAAPAGSMDGATYAVRLRDLESRVDELKDQIRRSHRRLSLLSDTIISGGGAGARAEIVLANEMSSAFRLVKATVIMDGAVQFNKQDESGTLAEQKEIPIYTGSIPSGDHTINIVLNFQGNGYGVFTYLKGYKFEVKSGHAFTAADGKTLAVRAVAMEKGGVTTPLEQRPAIEWKETAQALAAPGQAAQDNKGK